MANGPDVEQRDTQYGYGRTQPEFSQGERIATMEAEQKKFNEFAKERIEWQEKLTKEKLNSQRQEMDTKDKARQDAITKAEKAAAETATALATELRQTTAQTQTRLGALEVGGAGGVGVTKGSTELAAREYATRAEQQAQKATQVSIGMVIVTALALARAAGII